jgi:integrase/recombinase XerD
MTLFDSLFQMPSVRDRHNTAPLYKERIAYLKHMQLRDRKCSTIRAMACHLLQINRTLGFSDAMRVLTLEELKQAGRQWAGYIGPLRRRVPGKYSYELYMRIARGWLRFHSCLAEFKKSRISEARLRDYENAMRERFALAPSTIDTRSSHASYFLNWIRRRKISLRNLSVHHIEHYLDNKRTEGWALATRVTASFSLQLFLRHAEERAWVRRGLSQGVPTYALPQHNFVVRGPSWAGVQKIIASFDDKNSAELRDHAMTLLMALYGLRVGDIISLRLADIDFAHRVLTVTRRKNVKTQRFPLNRDTLDILRKYLDCARPASSCPTVFTTFVAPYQPLKRGTIYLRIRHLFVKNGIASRCKGPHALRHACANRLMKQHTPLRKIAAFLGHSGTRAVREYARYDLKSLRKIADFSLEGLI